jgi:hypothetical protein
VAQPGVVIVQKHVQKYHRVEKLNINLKTVGAKLEITMEMESPATGHLFDARTRISQT